MNKEMITHERLLQNAAFGAAEELVNIALSQKPFKDLEMDGVKPAMAIEVYKLNMFMLFGTLYDRRHRDDPRFQRVAERLQKLYETQMEEGFKQAWDEMKHIPGAAKIWQDSGVMDDPFEAYFEAIKSGAKEVDKTPFGILAKKLAAKYFPEDLQGTAFNVFAQLLPQAVVEVIEAVDKVPERYDIVEDE